MTNKNYTTIYIVRHGQSHHNANEDIQDEEFHSQWGDTQAPLTNEGIKQARIRAAALQHIHFDAIFSSDLTRAKQTAEIIKLERNLAIHTTSLIRERNHWQHVYTLKKRGKTVEEIEDEIRQNLQKLDQKAKMAYKISKDIESPKEAAGRLLTFLREIAISYSGKTVLVINHGNNMRSLLTHLGWATFDELPFIKSVENTGYIVLESDGVNFFVKETHGIHKTQNETRLF